MRNNLKKSSFKMSWRNFMAFLTLGILFHGVIEIKSFLMENFVHNDTEIKRKINYALNGFPTKKGSSQSKGENDYPKASVQLKDVK